MSAKNSPLRPTRKKEAFTLAERLLNAALTNNWTVEFAAQQFELTTGTLVPDNAIAEANASLWKIRQTEKASRMFDWNFRD